MKYISTTFLFILAIPAFGQIDTSEVKIVSKHYYEYTSGVRQCYIDNDSNASDSVIIDEKEITYPVIRTSDQALAKFINDTIQKIVGVNTFKETSQRLSEYTCIEDMPSELHVDYKIDFINSRYLSLTIVSDGSAGGGANGSSHYQIALTFDLQKRKILLLKNVIKEQYDSVAYNIFVAEMKKSSPNLFDQFGEVNNPDLFHFTSTLDHPIVITKEGIIIYWDVYFGTHPVSQDIHIHFDEHANMFDKKFTETVRKK